VDLSAPAGSGSRHTREHGCNSRIREHRRRGDAPDLPDFRASRLTSLFIKGNGSAHEHEVRPLQSGGVWSELVSMCAVTACPNMGPALAPLQVGEGVKEGVHVLAHAIRAGILAHPEDVALQLDYKNALISLSREAMRNAVATTAPQLFRYAALKYMHVSCLLLPEPPLNAQPLEAKSGVRQGDSSGPLFFALTLQDILETVQQWHS
jgi:hypothetical protein